MIRIVFSKKRGFTRVPSKDFYDDGNTFHCFLYKGLVPVTKFMYSIHQLDVPEIYADYRLDYLGYKYQDYQDLDTGRYDGVLKEMFDMDDFRSIGDKIIEYFGEDVLREKVAQFI